jgi:hypothetical protein
MRSKKNPRPDPILKELFIRQVAIELGVIPVTSSTVDLDFGAALANLPPDEARRAKRKFRKLWRKAQAEAQRAELWFDVTHPGGVPTKSERRRRKVIVASRIDEQATQRALQNNPKK